MISQWLENADNVRHSSLPLALDRLTFSVFRFDGQRLKSRTVSLQCSMGLIQSHERLRALISRVAAALDRFDAVLFEIL